MPSRHYLIVGGTRGIGAVLVERLAAESKGNRVSVLGRVPVSDSPSSAVSHYALDVSDRKALQSAIDRAVAQSGRLHSVVFLQRHRGGGDDFNAHLTVSLDATRNAIDHVMKEGMFAPDAAGNSIVLVSSIADNYIAPEQPLGYHVAKAGLVQLGRYYALHLGPSGIRVNCVSPCVVAKAEAAEFYRKNEWMTERYRSFIPLGRAGSAEDIVDAILFFAGDDASYITGQNLVVDGGLTLRSHESLLRDIGRGE